MPDVFSLIFLYFHASIGSYFDFASVSSIEKKQISQKFKSKLDKTQRTQHCGNTKGEQKGER